MSNVPVMMPSPVGDVPFHMMEQAIQIARDLAHFLVISGMLQAVEILRGRQDLVSFTIGLVEAGIVLIVVVQFQAERIRALLKVDRDVVDMREAAIVDPSRRTRRMLMGMTGLVIESALHRRPIRRLDIRGLDVRGLDVRGLIPAAMPRIMPVVISWVIVAVSVVPVIVPRLIVVMPSALESAAAVIVLGHCWNRRRADNGAHDRRDQRS